MNILFSKKIKLLLARRDKSLNKKELENNKLATDQVLYKGFVDEYNTDRPSYGADSFPGIFPQDASKFESCHGIYALPPAAIS